MSLPLNLPLSLMQVKWSSELNPLLSLPFIHGVELMNLSLQTGANTVNHMLQRQQQGWFITDINAAASIYRSQPFNKTTLTLTSSANCVVSLWVY